MQLPGQRGLAAIMVSGPETPRESRFLRVDACIEERPEVWLGSSHRLGLPPSHRAI